MGSEKTQSMFSARFWYACLAVGIIALSVVYTFSHKVDIRRCEERLTTTVEFIKDQTDSYVNYNNIAVAKSLMRGSTVIRTLEEISLDCSEAELKAYADKLWLTGISVLDQQGNVVCEYTEHGIGYAKKRYMQAQYGDTQTALMRGIKAAFDPKNILNPGKICY